MKTVAFKDGLAIHGAFPDLDVMKLIARTAGPLGLTIADPPYGNIVSAIWDKVNISDIQFAEWMLHWTKCVAQLSVSGSALYTFGGIGKQREGKKPPFRPFFRYLVEVELQTPYQLSTLITWKKKRAYGLAFNFLFCREEIAYLVLGNYRKPRMFNIPLLETKRGYAGYNEKYPAKSEFLRRSNVWDISEIFKGKVHEAQKPDRVMEIPIEVHTAKGEWVLDPFAGSGTTGLAARKLGRRFVVVEKDPVEFEKMIARLR